MGYGVVGGVCVGGEGMQEGRVWEGWGEGGRSVCGRGGYAWEGRVCAWQGSVCVRVCVCVCVCYVREECMCMCVCMGGEGQ